MQRSVVALSPNAATGDVVQNDEYVHPGLYAQSKNFITNDRYNNNNHNNHNNGNNNHNNGNKNDDDNVIYSPFLLPKLEKIMAEDRERERGKESRGEDDV